ncbi:ribosome hibernation-promoting factor, HPF/YfiA family [Croceimicrobium sp.]|uniref:ribosome hibernation-promoting factor, HPF/YfiA family n=1 Tax=Croceimicrobium sp. TaxID=2828340 RepID=UPI003BA95CB2|tara:strand:+ start:411 stop:710 length:300 start_codon:yes stop_codon:yes gene_type:complete
MKWDIQTVDFKATEELLSFTEEKVSGLHKYYDQIVGAEVYLKLIQDEANQNKKAEIKLNIPGNDLFAESHDASFEKAVHDAVDKLKGQIRKLKTKLQKH